MSKRFALLMILLLAFASLPAVATTVVVGTDEDLFDQAFVVLEGTVLSSSLAPSLPATQWRVRVERTLKGTNLSGDIVVRIPGGEDASGLRLTIWGAPSLQIGERTLLFLVRHADGTYGSLHLALGAFHEAITEGGGKLAVRDLSEMRDVAAGDPVPAADIARDAGRFATWIADRAAGLRRPADYFVPAAAGDLRRIREKFNYLGGMKQRWAAFDGGSTVSWRSQASGQPALADGGVDEFKAAIAAWNNDPSTNIRYRYDGTTAATSGFKRSDGVNALIFNDPNSEIDGTFTCSAPGRGSGILALGGTWSSSGSGGTARIGEGDVVTNDGVDCWFTTTKRAEQVFGHELGHTLGLGHSCGDDRTGECTDPSAAEALMRARAFSDERGARLNEDDRAGIFSLYSDGSAPPPPPPPPPPATPAVPTNLVATAASSTSIQLTWTDNAINETAYKVEMKKGTAAFQEVKSLSANAVSSTITGLKAQTNYSFRVRALNGSVTSDYSNLSSVTTPGVAQPPVAPSNLTATPVSAAGIRLNWKDNAANETGFTLEVSSPGGVVGVATPIDANAQTFTVNGLAPDTPYTFRVRAANAVGVSALSNPVSATTLGGPAGPCVTGAGDLCLLGNRFRVAVRFRANNAAGSGKAVPRSDQTGLFWFFDAANIELIVKMLDAQGLNGFFWTYYGGLSDVEYWVIVTDTQNGSSRTYHNNPGSLCGLGDVNAFAHPAADTAESTASLESLSQSEILPKVGCAPGTLCLQGGRFQVSVAWKTGGNQGTGTPVILTDQSGMFWFFNAANIELVIKVLDARTLNGKFWIYYGALSDVEYDLTVTDTTTGISHTYHNNPGNLCGKGDTSTFSG
jgi:Fibronectin type III domain